MSLAKAKEMEETARKDVDTVKMDVCVESEVKERRARVLGDNRAKDAAHVLALQDALGLSIQGVQSEYLSPLARLPP
jgi:hypothetical protein